MSEARSGDTVTVHYTGRLTDGTVFDTSSGGEPLRFTLGQQRVISGFEHAVLGMTPGDKKTTVVPSEQAYGEHRPDLVVEFQRTQMPQDITLQVGQALQLRAGWPETDRARDLAFARDRDAGCEPSVGRKRPDIRHRACRDLSRRLRWGSHPAIRPENRLGADPVPRAALVL